MVLMSRGGRKDTFKRGGEEGPREYMSATAESREKKRECDPVLLPVTTRGGGKTQGKEGKKGNYNVPDAY